MNKFEMGARHKLTPQETALEPLVKKYRFKFEPLPDSGFENAKKGKIAGGAVIIGQEKSTGKWTADVTTAQGLNTQITGLEDEMDAKVAAYQQLKEYDEKGELYNNN